MKKAAVVVAVLVVALTAGLWIFWPQVRIWQLRQALDRVVLPGLKAQIAATSGQEPVLTYRSLGVEGSAYVVENPALSLEGEPKLILGAQRLILDKVDLSLFGELRGCDLALHEVTLESQGFRLTMRNWEVGGLSVVQGGREVRVARELLQGLSIQGSGLPQSLELASIEGQGYHLTLDPDQRRYQGELGRLTALGRDFTVSLEAMTFAGDFVRMVQGRPTYEKADFSAKGLKVEKAGDPALHIGSLSGTSRRGESLQGDRIELKGVSMAPTDPAHAGFERMLAQFDYQSLNLDLVLDYVYDRKARSFSLKELTLAGKDAGRLELGLELTELDYDLGQDLGRNLPALKAAKTKRLSLRYDDASLTDRLMAYYAKQEGLGLEDYRQRQLAGLPALFGLDPRPGGAKTADPALAKARAQTEQALAAVRAFLAKPASLCLAVTPSQELTLAELSRMSPDLWPGVLDIKLDNCAK